MTKREMFNATIEILATLPNTSELVDGLKHEIEILDRKKTAERKPSKETRENEHLRDVIVSVLETAEKPMTITQIREASEELFQYTGNKIASLLIKLRRTDKKVKRTYVKKVAHFEIGIEEGDA